MGALAFQVEAGKGSQERLGAVAFQVASGKGSQDHLGAVAFQVASGEGSQDRLGAVAFRAGKGSQGRQLHRCSPLQPALVVLDKMRESGSSMSSCIMSSHAHKV